MREQLRNVAIIAHVDHGKTTLVDAILAQAGALAARDAASECILDRDPIERERGITIFSKNCAVTYRRRAADGEEETIRINVIDTPGHADFGGEVERVLRMADGALLLVDAYEGPMPQTRFVLSKALALGLRLIVVVNKCDRPDARPDAVVNEVFDLLVAMHADDHVLDFPVVYASGRERWASPSLDTPEAQRRSAGVVPLLETIVARIPAPVDDPAAPLRLLITTLDYSDYVGRIAIGRVHAGSIGTGEPVAICRADGSFARARVLRVHRFEGLGRTPVDRVSAGDLCAVEGLGEFDIGDTIADADQPGAMERVHVDEPTVHMIFRVNDSPFAGREGRFVTSRQLAERLERELKSNVAMRIEPGDATDEFHVAGRGLLHLGILLENMRREGYELAVGRPEVIEREIDGVTCEPIESLTVDVGGAALGSALELMGSRDGEIVKVEPRGDRMHVECEIPARGLIGLRSRMLTATGGEAVMYHSFLRWAPLRTSDRERISGVMVAIETGRVTAYALQNLADRGIMFVRPGDDVYAGQVVGEHNRENDLGVNITKAKAFSNVRESNKEATVTLKAPRLLSLEAALEYVEADELVEITPAAVRLRKRVLDPTARKREERARRDRARATTS